MSLRISHQNCNKVTTSKSTERRTPVECQQHQQQLPFTNVYIRSRFISTRPRSPFRKYEQCIRNSFKQKNYSSCHYKEKVSATTTPTIAASPTSIMKQDFEMPGVLQRYRTDLTINLTNFRLQKLAPLCTSTQPNKISVVSPERKSDINEEKEKDDPNLEPNKEEVGDPTSPICSICFDDKKEEIDELVIVEESLPQKDELKTTNDAEVDNKDDKIDDKRDETPIENECLKLPDERPKKCFEAIKDKEPTRRMKINAELLLLKISEIAEKKLSSSSSSQQRLPLDEAKNFSISTDNEIRSKNNFNNNKMDNANKKQTQQQHTSSSTLNRTKEKSKSVGELLFFRDSSFLFELINHPILKKQMENSPAST